MRPDTRSVSFVFQKDDRSGSKENENENSSSMITRRRLQDRFDKECPYSLPKSQGPKSLVVTRTWRNNFSLSSISASSVQTGRALRSGAQKITRTFSSVYTTLDEFSQRLRRSTRRRHRIQNESPRTPATPGTHTRKLLGRTPTKLYSPFAIETPRRKGLSDVTNRRNRIAGSSKEFGSVYSPHRKFASDIAATREGVAEFDRTAANIVRRSLRH